MTYSHFVVCATLVYIPPWVLSRSKKLHELGSTGNIAIGAVFYVLSQIAKLLLIATFLGDENLSRFSWTQELFKSIITSVDLLLLFFIFNYKNFLSGGDKDAKSISAGIGWAVGEMLFSRLIPLYFGATSLEFDWKWIQSGIHSNINLLLYISVAILMGLYTRKNIDDLLANRIRNGMTLYIFLPFINE
jgi:hypothetical protein